MNENNVYRVSQFHAVIVNGVHACVALATWAARQSIWFEMLPLPDERYELRVRPEFQAHLDNAIASTGRALDSVFDAHHVADCTVIDSTSGEPIDVSLFRDGCADAIFGIDVSWLETLEVDDPVVEPFNGLPVKLVYDATERSGSSIFIVTGRIPEDDDDTTNVYRAPDEIEAHLAFERDMYRDAEKDDEERDDIAARYGAPIYITNSLRLEESIITTLSAPCARG